MKFSEKLLKNYECGKMTVVKRKYGDYRIFSTPDFSGDLRVTDWLHSPEACIKELGNEDGCYSENQLNECAEKESWQIVKTIDFSELGGKGYELGCKVRVIETGEVGEMGQIIHGIPPAVEIFTVEFPNSSDFFHRHEIEPYFEEERECEEVPTMNLSERLDMIDRKIGIIFDELGVTELKCGILSKKKIK